MAHRCWMAASHTTSFSKFNILKIQKDSFIDITCFHEFKLKSRVVAWEMGSTLVLKAGIKKMAA